MKILSKTLMIVFLLSLVAACQPKTATTEAAAPAMVDGETVFAKNCASCHSLEPDKVFAGPSLAGIGTRAADTVPGKSAYDYILESIVNPSAFIPTGFSDRMPGSFGNRLTSEEIDSLVAYLLTLK